MGDTAAAALHRSRFPRSSAYDPAWVLDRIMGPHPLWLLEDLLGIVSLEPGMRVLDLGAGQGLTSAFLARECDVDVVAVDPVIQPSTIAETAAEQGVDHRVLALKASAHNLPLGRASLDAVVSIDAFHYFGTDDFYLDRLVPLLRPGGVLAVVSPSVTTELGGQPPLWAAPYWDRSYRSFHTPHWWRRHWETSGHVVVEVAEHVPDGAELWLDWNQTTLDHRDLGAFRTIAENETAMLRADAGRTFGFARLLARRPPDPH
jgi:cyclopropane fatty-acyl-phospholipid synthase-like methyltransferase